MHTRTQQATQLNARALSSFLLSLALLAACPLFPTAAFGQAGPGLQLVATFGEYSVLDGTFTVRVPQPDGKLEIARGQHLKAITATNPATGQVTTARNVSVTNTYSVTGWKAHPGWFVFAENERRVWAYDGRDFLWLVQILSPAGDSATYGPLSFPYPIPNQVRRRLPDSLKSKIEKAQLGP